jgi:hypothetical protein
MKEVQDGSSTILTNTTRIRKTNLVNRQLGIPQITGNEELAYTRKFGQI